VYLNVCDFNDLDIPENWQHTDSWFMIVIRPELWHLVLSFLFFLACDLH